MDKAVLIEDSQKSTTSSGRLNRNLIGSLVSLSFAFVVLLTLGTWYVTRLACYSSAGLKQVTAYNAEYDVGVLHNKDVLREHVLVDEVRETEVVIVHAPETQHITHIRALDFAQKLDVIFNSETGQCYFAHMSDSHPNFQQDTEALKQRNGKTVDGKIVAEYTVGERHAEAELIPNDLTAFCSSKNSYWLQPGTESKPDKRSKRSCSWECWNDCDYMGRCRTVCGLRCRF